jgi:hypothetical protein
MGAVQLYYVDYTQLSLDSLHCSITALGPHVSSKQISDMETVLTITVDPELNKNERPLTVRRLCKALLGVAITANELVGYTTASPHLSGAVIEFEKNGWASLE